MDVGTVVIVTNTSVVLATLLAKLYRIKIERALNSKKGISSSN
jgi:hypothetical protein